MKMGDIMQATQRSTPASGKQSSNGSSGASPTHKFASTFHSRIAAALTAEVTPC